MEKFFKFLNSDRYQYAESEVYLKKFIVIIFQIKKIIALKKYIKYVQIRINW